MDLRETLRQAGDNVEKAVNKVAKVSNKTATKAKIKHMIRSTDTSMNKIFVEIGKAFYEENKDAELAEPYAALVEQVVDLAAQKAFLEQDLAKLDETVTCSECGAKLNISQKFCCECGTKNARYDEMMAAKQAEEAAKAEAAEAEVAEAEEELAEPTEEILEEGQEYVEKEEEPKEF